MLAYTGLGTIEGARTQLLVMFSPGESANGYSKLFLTMEEPLEDPVQRLLDFAAENVITRWRPQ